MRTGLALTIGGVALSLVGAIVTVVYLFQPWRSCEYEDTSAGCAMLPGDAAVMAVAMLTVPVGIGVTAVGVLLLVLAARRPRVEGERSPAQRQVS